MIGIIERILGDVKENIGKIFKKFILVRVEACVVFCVAFFRIGVRVFYAAAVPRGFVPPAQPHFSLLRFLRNTKNSGPLLCIGAGAVSGRRQRRRA